jgi:hypothetical protein
MDGGGKSAGVICPSGNQPLGRRRQRRPNASGDAPEQNSYPRRNRAAHNRVLFSFTTQREGGCVMQDLAAAQPGYRWSVDAFKAFWSNPDTSKILGVMTEDIVGYWPRPIGVVRGASDYADVIEAIFKVCPDLRLKVPEDAVSGDFAFVRWTATGTGPAGPIEFTGCDRVRTRGGHVCENYVFCDDPFFARVAAELRKPG